MRTTISMILTVLIMIGFSILFTGCGTSEKTTEPTAIPVEIQDVKEADYQLQISYSGTVEASASISLSFPVTGLVDHVYAVQGQKVRKGELLASINGESFKNAYELSLAKQKQAEDAYRRFEPMFKNSTMPEIKMVEIQTGLKQATSATAIAKKNWDDCKMTAPADGFIGMRTIEPGMNALPSSPVFTLVQIDKISVRFPVPENEVSKIKKGQTAEIKIPALGTDVFQGKVDEIGVIANIMSRAYDVKINLPNPSGNIRPGMVCNVRLITDETDRAMVIPNQAVQVDETGDCYVYVADLNQNKAIKRKITLGPLLEKGICITGGLDLNEKIIVTGNHKLTDNAAISITQ